MHRAWSLLTVKSVNEDQRIITGIATTPEPDRVGDIVEPKGGVFTLPLPLLWQHRSDQPVGEVTAAHVTKDGIAITAQFAQTNEPGTLKNRLDEAWQTVKLQLVKGLSIGFNPIEAARIKDTFSYHITKWMWLELSAVTIPANADAKILTTKALKSYDTGLARSRKQTDASRTPDADGNVNCTNCMDCRGCTDCEGCVGCTDCTDCEDCTGCTGCSDCEDCAGCSGCSDCENCKGCTNCSDCEDCTGCQECSGMDGLDGATGVDPSKAMKPGAAIGKARHVADHPTLSGVSDKNRVVHLQQTQPGRPMKKSYAEQITQWEASRQAKSARMDELMEVAGEKGETLDAGQQEEHDRLATEIKDIDAHLVRLRDSDERAKLTAKQAAGGTGEDAAKTRATGVLTVKDMVPPGVRFARLAMLTAASRGSRVEALALAQDAYPGDQRLQEVIKAAVGGGTTSNGGGPLLQYTDYFQDFVNYLRPATIIGQFGQGSIPNLRPVPFNVRIATQTAGGTGYWVGQGKPAPLTKGVFSVTTLDFTKVGAISVLTKEEVRFANPSAEAKVRDDLRDSLVARIDQDFVDPGNAGTANVKPPSITAAVVATPATGTTITAFKADFKSMMSHLIAANITPKSGVLIMSSTMALSLSLMLNALGQPEFPELTMQGGTLKGFPVIVSEFVHSLGSPSSEIIVFVNASDVYLADDGAVTVEASDQASLEMSDAPTQDGTTGTGASMVSLWQTGMLGLKAERFINWKLRRAAAAQYISGAAYA